MEILPSEEAGERGTRHWPHAPPHRLRPACVFFLALLAFGFGPAAAHQDVKLKFKDGIILGLPEEFGPAKFDREKKILTLGGKALPLPDMLRRNFRDHRLHHWDAEAPRQAGEPRTPLAYDLAFTASWYHDPLLLPPYLLMKVTPKDRDFRYEILFDMEKPGILEAHVIHQLTDSTSQSFPIQFENSKPEPAKEKPDEWPAMIGKWRGADEIVEITGKSIKVTLPGNEKPLIEGAIAPVEPGVMSLKSPGGKEQKFTYLLRGDILQLGFEDFGIRCARFGSPTDEKYERWRNLAPATLDEQDE